MSDDPKDDPTQKTLVEPLKPASSTTASSTAPRFNDPVIGVSVDGYVVKSRLGAGGMGIVYEGEHSVIGKRAAIKVLRPEYSEDPKQLERLVAEARAVNEVGHRGIIDVFGYGQLPDGRQCIVMEYLDGKSLEDVLKAHKKADTKMPIADVLEVLDEVLSALSAAHSAKVVHRDLKPSNIFLVHQRDAKFVKLLDFGIAKLGALGGSTPVSRASMIAGTPTYMAPEQARGAAASPQMDLYSIGIMAFEMLTGQPPFDADSVVGMLMMHAENAPKRPSQLRSEVPDPLDELVLRLLAKKPEERFRTAEHVRAEVVRMKAHLKDPDAHRTLQDDAPMPSVMSEILPLSVNDTMTSSRPALKVSPKGDDEEETKKTQYKPLTAEPEAASKVRETMLVAKAPRNVFSESQELAVQKSRLPVFLLAAGAGALFVAAAFVALRPTDTEPVAVAKPVPVAKPTPPPAAPAVVAEPVKPPEPPRTPEPAPTPPPVVVAPTPPEPPTPPPTPPPAKPSPVVAAPKPVEQPPPSKPAPKPAPVVAAAPRVAPPPPPPSKSAIAASGLVGRLKKLEARLDKAQQGGTEVSLYLKQVQRIRQKIEAGPLSSDDQSRVEVALDNLEKSDEY